MFFSPRSPYVQILCSVEGAAAGKTIQAVRVNDELIPCFSQAGGVAESYWLVANTDLIIYVAERVVRFNLSRFPDIQLLLTEDHAPPSALL
jgi:hypothetical protein